MKIKLQQIKGDLKIKVENSILELEDKGYIVGSLFLFNDIDFQYSWRSKGKYIAIRYTAPNSGFQEYHDKKIYLK